MGAVRTRELPDEAGFPYARLAHDGDRLPVSCTGALERSAEHLDLGVPADEPCKPAGGGGMEPRAPWSSRHKLEDFDRSLQPFHRHGPE